ACSPAQRTSSTQLTSFSVVASCGLLPGPAHEFNPAHEFFCSRKLRLAPQDYSPWTPLWTAFLSVAILPLRDTRRLRAWSPVHLARTRASFAQRPRTFW